jgi:hypothetical protein
MSAEWEPVEGYVAGTQVKVDADTGALLLEGCGAAEEVAAGSQVNLVGSGVAIRPRLYPFRRYSH